jgi:membrane protein DedA with SNARE-associated domain
MFTLDHLPQLPNGALLYLILAAIVIGSSIPVVALVIAAEPFLMAVVILAGDGHPSISALLAVTVGGAVLGDVLGYVLGWALGPKLSGSRFVRRSRKQVYGAQRHVRRRGVLGALVMQRWVPPTRGLVPALLGTVRHPFGQFVIRSTAAATLWAVVIVIGTHVAGPALVLAVPAVLVIPVVIRVVQGLVSRLRDRRRRPAGCAPG